MQTSALQRRTRRRLSWLQLRHLWFALDFFAPLALFYGLIWSGFSLYFALLASAALSAISAVVSFVRGTSGQRFAPYMLALSLGAFGIALISGSDRFLLAKESILTAAVGCWFLASIWTDRPLTYVLTRPLLESAYGRKVGIFGPLSWEELWATDDSFRHIFKVSSVMWAGATMLDAVLRVVIAYTLPVSAVPGLHLALFVVTLLLMQVVTNVYYARSGLWTLIRDGGIQHHADSTQRRGTHHEPDNP